MDRSLVDYCGVFISCLDCHIDGTHSLKRIHLWASDVMLQIYIYIFFFFLYSDSQSSLMLFWTPLLLYEQNSSTVESKSYMNDMMVSKWCYNLNFWVNFPSLLQLNRHNCWVNINIFSVLMAAVIEYICSWEGLSCRTQVLEDKEAIIKCKSPSYQPCSAQTGMLLNHLIL